MLRLWWLIPLNLLWLAVLWRLLLWSEGWPLAVVHKIANMAFPENQWPTTSADLAPVGIAYLAGAVRMESSPGSAVRTIILGTAIAAVGSALMTYAAFITSGACVRPPMLGVVALAIGGFASMSAVLLDRVFDSRTRITREL